MHQGRSDSPPVRDRARESVIVCVCVCVCLTGGDVTLKCSVFVCVLVIIITTRKIFNIIALTHIH